MKGQEILVVWSVWCVLRQSAKVVGAEKSEAFRYFEEADFTYCKYMFMGYIETDVAMHMHTSLSPAVMLICLQQVAVMNSLTVNLHLLFVPWLSLAHNYATARAIWSDFDLNKSTSCWGVLLQTKWQAQQDHVRGTCIGSHFNCTYRHLWCVLYTLSESVRRPKDKAIKSPLPPCHQASAFGSDYFAFESQATCMVKDCVT